MRKLLFALGAAATFPAAAAVLTPNHGPVAYTGQVAGSDGEAGAFSVEAVLRQGSFAGQARLSIGGVTIAGPLLKRSYLENGRCYFYLENGRERAEFGGPCATDRIEGRFDLFHPSTGGKTGTITGKGSAAAAKTSAAPVPLPTAKLTCAYQDRRIGVGLGQTTQYSLAFSNLGSLTLSPGGSYRAGTTGGRYVRSGDKIKLASGPWAGAIGSIERDRSGEPAVVFHIDENRRADGVHRVDPYTTRCTQAR